MRSVRIWTRSRTTQSNSFFQNGVLFFPFSSLCTQPRHFTSKSCLPFSRQGLESEATQVCAYLFVCFLILCVFFFCCFFSICLHSPHCLSFTLNCVPCQSHSHKQTPSTALAAFLLSANTHFWILFCNLENAQCVY